MSRVCTLVALTAAALMASAGRASAAHVTAPAPAAARGGVVNAVTAVSIVPSSGRAEVVVAISGPVEVSDFVLSGPDRVVLDLSGARLGLPAHMYDKVSRAGITMRICPADSTHVPMSSHPASKSSVSTT